MAIRAKRWSAARRAGLAAGLASSLAGCATPQQRVEQKEDNLAAAGFLARPANTPERQAMLQRLPANTFFREVKGDEIHYVYADPLVCSCLYVGSQEAYGAYQRHMQEQRLAEEKRLTAQLYSDPAWNWGAWGPWGPGYGFGAGYGW